MPHKKQTQENIDAAIKKATKIAEQIKEENPERFELTFAERLKNLSVKIADMPGFSLQEFLRITKIRGSSF